MAGEPAREHLRVQGDQSADAGARVPHHQDLADQGVAAQTVLESGGGDVLAARCHDDLLLAACDPQEALGGEGAEVAGS